MSALPAGFFRVDRSADQGSDSAISLGDPSSPTYELSINDDLENILVNLTGLDTDVVKVSISDGSNLTYSFVYDGSSWLAIDGSGASLDDQASVPNASNSSFNLDFSNLPIAPFDLTVTIEDVAGKNCRRVRTG